MKRNSVLVAFGAEIRRRRESRGMTLDDLSAGSGLSPNFIGQIEAGRRNPSILSMLSIAKGLAIDPTELLGGHEGLSPEGLEAGRLIDLIPPLIRRRVLDLLHALAAI